MKESIDIIIVFVPVTLAFYVVIVLFLSEKRLLTKNMMKIIGLQN